MKGGKTMKKVVSIALVLMMALSIAACTGKSGDATARVKCPACGYEFDAPQE
jgi:hypothetical protein